MTHDELKFQADLLSDVLSSVMANIAVIDSTGKIVYVNEPWKRFWRENNGDEALVSDWSEVNYLDVLKTTGQPELQEIGQSISMVIRGEIDSFRVEYPCHSPDQQRWFMMTVTPTPKTNGLAVVMHMDISERKLLEERLNSSELHFRQSQDFAEVSSWEMDIDHRILYLSSNIRSMFGIQDLTTQMPYSKFLEAVHRDDRQRIEDAVEACIAKQVKLNINYRIIMPGGKERWFNTRGNVLKDSTGKPIRAYGIIYDITATKNAEQKLLEEKNEQKKLIEQLHNAQTQLLQSEKMASIGQLAAGVAHEINNPVGYVNSNISSLKRYIDDIFRMLDLYERAERSIEDNEVLNDISAMKKSTDLDFIKEDIRALLNESEEGVNRVKRIVADLKDFSHVDESEWQHADLHKGIESTLNVVWNEIKYRAEVVREYGDLPFVECIPSQLNQVFMNILVNAAHAIEDRGVITIATGQLSADRIWIEIRDNGTGMSEKTVKRIFEPFFTTKPVGEGTGLGLSLSYSIVEKHGGQITVQSRPGSGTTFRIELPIEKQLDYSREGRG